MGEALRVLVVDRHPLYLRGLRMLLESSDRALTIRTAGGLDECMEEIDRERPDVVLLQLDACGHDVQAAVRRVRSADDQPVLLFATSAPDDEVVLALEAGASGFMAGTSDSDGLVTALRAAASGECVVEGDVVPKLVERLREQQRARCNCPDRTDTSPFSAREVEILRLVGNGDANAEIARKLSISPSTVKNHLNRIFDKLGVSSRCEAVVEGMRKNLICCSRCPVNRQGETAPSLQGR